MKQLLRAALACTLAAGLLAPGGARGAVQPSGRTQVAAEPTIQNPVIVESSDGTPIVATLMLPAGASKKSPAPVVLQTHGWGGSRGVEPTGILQPLLNRGYAVMTWDSRGFGESGGEANIGAPGFEVADARALIDYLAKRPEIQKDAPGDPRLGWIGGSNAAGVQFNTAAIDKRVDAIVPEISWGDLVRDLLPGGVLKQTGFAQGSATGDLDESLIDWFSTRSTTRRSHKIDAPTLIIQGSVDTLFPLNDGFENYRNLVGAGTPVKLMTYCAGHTLGCDYPGGASGDPRESSEARPVFEQRILAWLDRYVAGKRVSTGAPVEWQAQDGFYYRAPSYPLPRTRMKQTRVVSDVSLVGPGTTGGDGLADGGPAPQAEIGITAHRATVVGRSERPRPILGNPRLAITGRTLGVAGHAFFELVDVAPDGTRLTLDDQVMPRKLPLGKFKVNFDMHGVSWMLEEGHSLELEITTGSTQYSTPRTGPYQVTFDEAALSLPMTSFDAHRRKIKP